MKKTLINVGLFLLIYCFFGNSPVFADDNTNVKVVYGTSSFFVGVMAALWAQKTNRSALTWFLFGWFLPPFACLFAFLKNKEN